MRVTYLTGQNPESVDLGPVVVPGGGVQLPPGTRGQVISYDSDGNPIAVDAEAASIRISADLNNALQFGDDGGLYVFETIGTDGGIDLTVLFDNQII